ncbi:MAG: NifB/NifX family molybdenum-iron cluster-binding protein [Armatimonadota bacterium]
MKIAVASNSPSLDDGVVTRLGTCNHLLIIDAETMDYEVLPGAPASEMQGTGIRMITLAASHGAEAVITSYIRPQMEGTLQGAGIEIIAGVDGSVRKAVEGYLRKDRTAAREEPGALSAAVQRSLRQFGNILPVLLGVMLLAGLLKVFISREALTAIFSGRPVTDTLWGAVSGSIFAGNAVNSYVIGAALRDAGVSLFAVTAMIITWVTVGIVQLPAEASALGTRFTIVRNAVAFVVSLGVAMLTVLAVEWFS